MKDGRLKLEDGKVQLAEGWEEYEAGRLEAEQTIADVPASFVLDIPVMLGVMAVLTVPALIRGKLSRVQGIVLLCVYAAFCTLQFVM